MTTSNRTHWMWPWAAAIAAVTLVCVVMPTLDHYDAQAFSDDQAATLRQLQAERRQQLHAMSVCHRAFGPNTAPAEDVDGNLVCVDRKGRAAKPLMVASK
jgi:hypothetical protein